jgi:hypothetical protein
MVIKFGFSTKQVNYVDKIACISASPFLLFDNYIFEFIPSEIPIFTIG